MAITYDNSPLKWGNDGAVPSEDTLQNGYTAGEKLPASHLNYLIKNKELVETELQNKLSDLHTTVANKVDKAEGKGLSTNDYTTAEKTKLTNIAEGANQTVIENVLTSTSTTNALSAAQGKALNDTKLPLAGGTITGNLTVNGTFTNTALNTTIANKVDKVSGKQLSTNDYTTAEKTKLTNIAEGANKTVVENVLTSTSTTNALSAAQGKALNDSKVDKVSGKQLSTNDYTTEEKNKLANIATGATANVVENVLTSTSTTNALSAAQGKVLNDTIATKVDKVEGKQLSTNDYTTAEKNKLANIATGATANVVENVLTSTSTTNALSAAQGKILNDNKLPLAGGTITGNLTVNGTTTTTGALTATGGVVGNVTGAVTGNASTATKLQTARTINGVSFDGSANITVADNTKLPLAGGTVTGNLTVNGTFTNTALNNTIATKVDKVEGKQLSTNDYTTAEKNKLANIATGATANVVENVLTSTNGATALSANMGKLLNDTKWHYHGVIHDADLDELKTTGSYSLDNIYKGTAGVNYPIQTQNGHALLEVNINFGNRIIQKMHIPVASGDMAVFERWWADGVWKPWSQISTGSIDLTYEFNANVQQTVNQMLRIQNGKFNICRDFNSLSAGDKGYAAWVIPSPLLSEGGRLWFTFTHHGINDRNYRVSTSQQGIGNSQGALEYRLEVYSTSHPDRKYQLFKPYGRGVVEVKNDWYVCNFSTV